MNNSQEAELSLEDKISHKLSSVLFPSKFVSKPIREFIIPLITETELVSGFKVKLKEIKFSGHSMPEVSQHLLP